MTNVPSRYNIFSIFRVCDFFFLAACVVHVFLVLCIGYLSGTSCGGSCGCARMCFAGLSCFLVKEGRATTARTYTFVGVFGAPDFGMQSILTLWHIQSLKGLEKGRGVIILRTYLESNSSHRLPSAALCRCSCTAVSLLGM